jgi:anti-sigma factor RsiW
MKCEDLKNLIPEYLQGDLEQFDLDEISSHLFNCPNCREELELFEKSWSLLDSWEEISPSPGFQSAVMREIRKERQQQKKSFIDMVISLFRFNVPAWAAALMIITGIFMNNVLVTMSETENHKTGERVAHVESVDKNADSQFVAMSDSSGTLFPRAGDLFSDEIGDLVQDTYLPDEWDKTSVFNRVEMEELFNM